MKWTIPSLHFDTYIVANREYSKKKNSTIMANIEDPNETVRSEPSHLDLHCLQRYLYWSAGLKELTHFRLNKLYAPPSHTLYWNFRISVVRMSGYNIPREKWLNYLQTVDILIRRRITRRLNWVCTVCQIPVWGSPGLTRLRGLMHWVDFPPFCTRGQLL